MAEFIQHDPTTLAISDWTRVGHLNKLSTRSLEVGWSESWIDIGGEGAAVVGVTAQEGAPFSLKKFF